MEFKTETYFDLETFSYKELFENKDYPWEALSMLEEFIQEQFVKGSIVRNYKDSKDVHIGEGTVVKEGVLIDGPAIIGKNCIIGHSVYFRKGCIVGDNVNIGHGVEVKHSVIMDGSAVAHLNYIGDSIIGNRVNIAGGVVTANWRLDKKAVAVKSQDGSLMHTGLNKLGAIIGDDANIGANAVLNPGTILGKKTTVFPLTSVSGTHPDNETIR